MNILQVKQMTTEKSKISYCETQNTILFELKHIICTAVNCVDLPFFLVISRIS